MPAERIAMRHVRDVLRLTAAGVSGKRPGCTLSGALGENCHISDHNRSFLDAYDPRLLPYVQTLVDAFARPADKFSEYTF